MASLYYWYLYLTCNHTRCLLRNAYAPTEQGSTLKNKTDIQGRLEGFLPNKKAINLKKKNNVLYYIHCQEKNRLIKYFKFFKEKAFLISQWGDI